jgi:(p)ppGpp synthase/HD superfamily hydrolase
MGGRDYIGHVVRVGGMAAIVAGLEDARDALIVGLLHDGVEDTSVTLDDLRAEGFPEQIISGVDAISRRKPRMYPESEDDEAYLKRIKADRLARSVKTADSLDNSDERKLLMVADETLRAKRRQPRGLAYEEWK